MNLFPLLIWAAIAMGAALLVLIVVLVLVVLNISPAHPTTNEHQIGDTGARDRRDAGA